MTRVFDGPVVVVVSCWARELRELLWSTAPPQLYSALWVASTNVFTSIYLWLQHLRLNLDRNIRGLIDFKVVLQTISNIQSLTISVEIKIKEIQETYNVLEEHQLKVSGVELWK